jgi:protease-4
MSVQRLREVAKGRVWTGADAKGVGLVDELGGLSDAVSAAATRAGLSREEVDVRTVPRVSPLARLRPAQNSDSPAAAAFGGTWAAGLLGAGSAVLGEGRPLLDAVLASLGLPPYGVLTMPVVWRLR